MNDYEATPEIKSSNRKQSLYISIYGGDPNTTIVNSVSGLKNRAIRIGTDNMAIGTSLIEMPQDNFSFFIWVKKRADYERGGILFKYSANGAEGDSTTYWKMLIDPNNDRNNTFYATTNNNSASYTWNQEIYGGWKLIGFVKHQGTIDLYINNVKKTTIENISGQFPKTGSFYVGGRIYGAGRVDIEGMLKADYENVMVFNKEITQQDIDLLYNSGTGQEDFGNVESWMYVGSSTSSLSTDSSFSSSPSSSTALRTRYRICAIGGIKDYVQIRS